jgi:hypothetical protein
MEKFLILFLFAISLVNCSYLKYPNYNPQVQFLSSTSINRLDGIYKNYSGEEEYFTLDYLLMLNRETMFNKNIIKPNKIELKVINKKKIKLLGFLDDKIIIQKTLRGKLKNGYFTINRIYKLPLFTGILNIYDQQKVRIGLYKNGNIRVDMEGGACFLIGPMPMLCSNNSVYEMEFNKLE